MSIPIARLQWEERPGHERADRSAICCFRPSRASRAIARDLYAGVKDLPIVSPHGHTDPRWYAENEPFPDPAQLLIVPDHYVFRMLFSQGVRLEELGVPTARRRRRSRPTAARSGGFSPRTIYLFRGTPTRLWFDYVLSRRCSASTSR